jgi:TetR/AcrR family transcriptional regulator, regulator of cefoperazone and chloramphenicol sensitivity
MTRRDRRTGSPRPVPSAPHDHGTRRRVLEVATRLFAESGFKRVTVRAICRDARANVAAVNYHFRDKVGLYTEVLGQAVSVMRETTAAASHAAEGRAPADQLRAYARVVTERIFAQGADSWLHQLINREMADPTPLFATLVEDGMRPRLEFLSRIIGSLLNRPADDAAVMMCVCSLHSQVVMFRPSPMADQIRARFNLPPFTPELVADHIVAFTLAGLEAFNAVPARPRIVKSDAMAR